MTLIHQVRSGAVADGGWADVCALTDLEVERGRAALIDGEQVALFLLYDRQVHALSNLDPYSAAHVISRGIVGTRQGVPTVASPMYKQVFDLRTGACLDAQGKEPMSLHVWPAVVSGGRVLVERRMRVEGKVAS